MQRTFFIGATFMAAINTADAIKITSDVPEIESMYAELAAQPAPADFVENVDVADMVDKWGGADGKAKAGKKEAKKKAKKGAKPAAPADQQMKMSDGGFAAEMGIELSKTAKPAGPKAAKKVDKNAGKTKAEVTMESYPLRTRRELRKYLANKTSILCFGYIDHIDELMQLFMTA